MVNNGDILSLNLYIKRIQFIMTKMYRKNIDSKVSCSLFTPGLGFFLQYIPIPHQIRMWWTEKHKQEKKKLNKINTANKKCSLSISIDNETLISLERF